MCRDAKLSSAQTALGALIRFCALVAAALCLPVAPAHAAQVSGAVNVQVTLQPSTVTPGLCKSTSAANALGAHATVVCSSDTLNDHAPTRPRLPWSPMNGGGYRFVTQAFWNGDSLDSLDDTPGTGTITSWRIVNLVNRRYIELVVGW